MNYCASMASVKTVFGLDFTVPVPRCMSLVPHSEQTSCVPAACGAQLGIRQRNSNTASGALLTLFRHQQIFANLFFTFFFSKID